MRLPVVPQISTKDGTSNKNARLTNCLKESKKGGDKAVVRPGLVLDAQASGIGHGLVVFNNELVSVYGATLGFGVETTSEGYTEYSLSNTDCEFNTIDAINSEFIAFSLDTNIGELKTFTGDGSFFTEQSYGVATGNDAIMTATSGASFLVGTDNLSGNGYADQTELYRTAIGGTPSFTAVKVHASYSLKAIRYCGSKYVAVLTLSFSGTRLWHSADDGVTFTSKTISTDNSFFGKDVCYDGTKWVIFGWNATQTVALIKTTTDFVSFSDVTPLGDVPRYFNNVLYFNSTFIGRAWDNLNMRLIKSSDGITWAYQSSDFDSFPYLLKVVGSSIYTTNYDPGPIGNFSAAVSSDGITWASTLYNNTTIPSDLAIQGSEVISSPAGIASGWHIWWENILETSGTIPALATITGDYYDFAQSPI